MWIMVATLVGLASLFQLLTKERSKLNLPLINIISFIYGNLHEGWQIIASSLIEFTKSGQSLVIVTD